MSQAPVPSSESQKLPKRKHVRALPSSELELREEKPVAMSALPTPRAATRRIPAMKNMPDLLKKEPQFRCRYHLGEYVEKV
jgi:hypothetical protein